MILDLPVRPGLRILVTSRPVDCIHPPKTAGQVERFRRLAVMPPGYGPGPAAASAMASIH